MPNSKETYLEKMVREALEELGVPFEQEKTWYVRYCVVYCTDFYLPELNLVIEADGDRYHTGPEQEAHDQERDAWFLEEKGVKVYRLSQSAIEEDVRAALLSIFEAEELV